MSQIAKDREHAGREHAGQEPVSSVVIRSPANVRSAEPETITLSELLRRSGPLSEALAARIGRSVARKLVALHATGTFHGDLSPENIALPCDGGPDAAELLGGNPRVPADGQATFEFRSPEQLAGQSAGAASDVYSLGALLFCALTGHPPFQGAPRDVVRMHLVEPAPPVAGLSPHRVSPLMSSLVRDCLAKRPEARPASAADLTAVLGSLCLSVGGARESQGTEWARAADRWGRPRPRRVARVEPDGPCSHVGVVVRRLVATVPPPSMESAAGEGAGSSEITSRNRIQGMTGGRSRAA